MADSWCLAPLGCPACHKMTWSRKRELKVAKKKRELKLLLLKHIRICGQCKKKEKEKKRKEAR
jgi:hypothetical protein